MCFHGRPWERWNKCGRALRFVFSGRRDGWRQAGAPLLIYDIWRHLRRPAGTPGRDRVPQLCKPSLEKHQRWGIQEKQPACRDACLPRSRPGEDFLLLTWIKWQRWGQIFNGGGLVSRERHMEDRWCVCLDNDKRFKQNGSFKRRQEAETLWVWYIISPADASAPKASDLQRENSQTWTRLVPQQSDFISLFLLVVSSHGKAPTPLGFALENNSYFLRKVNDVYDFLFHSGRELITTIRWSSLRITWREEPVRITGALPNTIKPIFTVHRT